MTEKWIHDDGKRLDCLNGKDVCLDFIEKFGGISTDEASGELVYCGKGDVCYRLPADLADEQILEAIEKSVKDNHDYVIDLIGKPENESPKPNPDWIY